MTKLQISFDPYDQIDEEDASILVADIRGAGGEDVEIIGTTSPKGFLGADTAVTLISLTVTSAATLSVIAAFLYSAFRKGVLLDLTGASPKISKSNKLPLGSLLILYRDGRQELHESTATKSIGEIIKAAIGNSK